MLLLGALAASTAPAKAAGMHCPAVPSGHCFSVTVPLDRGGTVPGVRA